MPESEDKTHAPSARRRQLARERGQVARSPELTAAVGLLATSAAVGALGGRLVEGLAAAVRRPIGGGAGMPWIDATPEAVAARLRESIGAVGGPLAAILATGVGAAAAIHQAQVRGLWAPGLLAPDPGRIWSGLGGGGWSARAARGGWGLAKAAAVAAAATWAIASGLPEADGLARLGPIDLARASASILARVVALVAALLIALGLVDFAIQWFRLEAQLRLTPDEAREELKALDGDPALRARRRRLARGRSATPASLDGAKLALLGGGGLCLVLGGDAPPRGRLRVLAIGRGTVGASIARLAERSHLPTLSDPALALHLARGRSGASDIPPDLVARLVAAWPAA